MYFRPEMCIFDLKSNLFDLFSRFASNSLYSEDRAGLRHTAATRRIRLSYPEVLISWQITGIGTLSILNAYLKHSISHISMGNPYYRKYLFTLLIPQAIHAVTVILWITVLIRRAIHAVTVIRPETDRKPAGNRPESGRNPAGSKSFS